MARVVVNHERSFNDSFYLLQIQRTCEDWLMDAVFVPVNKTQQGHSLKLEKGCPAGPGFGVSSASSPPELNDLLYSTLSLHLAGAGQQCKQDCLWVSKPGPSPNIRSNNAVDLLALTPEESQLLQNVPWSIHNAVFDLSQRLIDKWSDFNRLSCTFTS